MKQLTVTRAEYEAMEKEVASMTKELEVMGKEVEAKHKLEVSTLLSTNVVHTPKYSAEYRENAVA